MGTTLLRTTAHLLHKATLSRPGDIAYLPNTQKQTQRVRQNEETKEYVPKKELVKTLEKEVNETEISNLSNKEFKIMVIRILTELSSRMEEHSENFNKEIANKKEN